MSDQLHEQCQECLMIFKVGAYHPYAACLMFKACGCPSTVEENLKGVIEHGKNKNSESD